MRLKLDENLGERGGRPPPGCRTTSPPFEQGLTSEPDPSLIAICRDEDRCLVTLDLDFANPLRFRPGDYRGIAVLRLPPRSSQEDLLDAVRTLAGGLERGDITGKLWVVQIGLLREYRPEDPD